jgi:DNA repair exonuclease SbcCD ATPase subunit
LKASQLQSKVLEKDETISQLLQQLDRAENQLKLQMEMTIKLQQDLEAREKKFVDSKEKRGENNADQYKQFVKMTHELRSVQEQLRLEKEKVLNIFSLSGECKPICFLTFVHILGQKP